jgi:DNA-binding transcriptional regulator YhcF (GntR family)
MIEFRLDARSGVPAYLQLVHQVRQALSLGLLQPGDQLPTVKEVAARVAINPNTVLKAYRELDHEGLVDGRRGQGTFVSSTIPAQPAANHTQLRAELGDWIARARRAGLEDESIVALMTVTLQSAASTEAAA